MFVFKVAGLMQSRNSSKVTVHGITFELVSMLEVSSVDQRTPLFFLMYSDILSAARVTLNIPGPTLPTSRSQFTLADIDKTRRIASVRIFVECAIGRIKGYHILDGTMPISLAPLVDHIVHVCVAI